MHKLLKFDGANDVVMYLPNGQEMNVELSQAGVLAFQEVEKTTHFTLPVKHELIINNTSLFADNRQVCVFLLY